jgi:hypothetical protein
MSNRKQTADGSDNLLQMMATQPEPSEKNNGTYVQPHQQTNPNNTTSDNYGTRPNVNPYTGAAGTHRGY